MAKHKRIHDAVDKFLAEKRVSTGGWAPCSDADLAELSDLIDRLITAKFGPDPDGDYPVRFQLVNRLTHESLRFDPVPYPLWIARDHLNRRGAEAGNHLSELAANDPEAYEECREGTLMDNLGTAVSQVDANLRERRLERSRKASAAKKENTSA